MNAIPSSSPLSADAAIADTDIAVIGLAGRFPGAPDVDTLWRNLRDGIESIVRYDDEVLRAMGVDERDLADPLYVKAGAPLPDADKFDAAFFGYSPREAEEMDPQHRLFLETAWQAMEHAGYDPTATPLPVGVYAGVGVNTYLLRHLLPSGRYDDFGDISALQGLMNGNNKDSLATTVAYKLNLHGPAVTVQTACSTSLAAVHIACRGLLNHEADMAVAGGVWINLVHNGGYRYQPGAILSPDGHCRAFDADAAGTVIGSGMGAVTLKRLADALTDGDTVHAVIKGSALNNDGASKIGYTAPSVQGQAEVIMAAQAMADVTPDTISYIEAHGTGTVMGDPIEIAALTQAFRAGTDRVGFCGVGSIKSNVGHLDAAAGIAGLIKTVLALKHRTLPPSLHFNRPNPEIDFAASPFYVVAEHMEWPAGSTPRRAGVSSFGIGGSNVHVVLEEAPPAPATASESRPWHLLPLSARTPTALDNVVSSLRDHLAGRDDEPLAAQSLADVAHTLQAGRKTFSSSAVALVRGREDAVAVLGADAGAVTRLVRGARPADDRASVAFLFPGQGAQRPNMGRGLYEQEPVFREEVDRCAEILRPELGLDLRDILYPPAGADVTAAAEPLSATALTQPALFVIEYALARLLGHWGVRPAAMVGHSVGEYVAACLAGVFEPDDALRLVAARGRLIQAQPAGAMLAVNLSEADAMALLGDGCDLAAVNGPDRCVLAGPETAIAARETECQRRGVAAQRLRVSHAFHSAMVAPAGDALAALVAATPRRAPTLPFLSNVSGTWITADEAVNPAYWAQHLRAPVRFFEGVERLLADPAHVLLEVGPGETLSRLVLRFPAATERAVIAAQADRDQTLTGSEGAGLALGRLWAAGVAVNWSALYGNEQRRRVPLPTYPFERKSYWVAAGKALSSGGGGVDDMTRPLDQWFYAPSWRRRDAVLTAPTRDDVTGCVVVLGDDGPANAISEAVAAATTGATTVTAVAGPAFARLAPARFVVRPGEAGDLDAVLAAVNEEFGPVARIIHLWSLAQPDSGGWSFETLQMRGYFTLTGLAAVLERRQPAAKADIVTVTSGVEEVSGREALTPGLATLWGPVRVVPQEYPNVGCRLIDADPCDAADPAWAALVAAEVLAATRPVATAIRGRHVWEQVFLTVQRALPPACPFRSQGVYLITGGLGGVGLVLAEALARRVQARLVLVGRNAPGPAQRAKIAELEALGAVVVTMQADVGTDEGVAASLAAANDGFGALHGVIHAAGDPGGGLIAVRTGDQVAQTLAAKVKGTDALLAVTADVPLDFILLCASLSAVAGGVAKADYAAANAYLEAVAQNAARRTRFPVIAVGWDAWRDVGMAANMAMPDGVGIPPAVGAEVFERIIAAPSPRVLVSTLDLERRLALAQGDLLSQPLPAAGPMRAGRHARPELATLFIAPQGELEEGLAVIWREMLGVADVGVDDNLFELGGDSLLGIQILSRARAKYQVELHPAPFFKQPTIAGLAVLVETRLIEEIERAAAE